MKKLLLHLSVAFLAMLAVTPAQAVEFVYIEQSVQDTVLPASVYEQSFVANAGNISAVSVYVTAEAASIVTVQIRNAVCGDPLRSGSGAGTGAGWVKCDLNGVQGIVPGQTYSVVVNSNQNLGASSADPYAAGSLWQDCLGYSGGAYDLVFRAWGDEEVVPEGQATWGAVKSLYR